MALSAHSALVDDLPRSAAPPPTATNRIILRVAVPSPLPQLFDYLPPAHCPRDALQIGVRVAVPFATRQLVGLLLELSADSAIPDEKLRCALEILDSAPLLPPDVLALTQWAIRYYHHAPGEVLMHALPTPLREGKSASAAPPAQHWQISAAGRAALNATATKISAQQLILLTHLAQCHEGATTLALRPLVSNSTATLRSLHTRGWIAEREALTASAPYPSLSPPPLNSAQAAAVNAIIASFGRFQVFLLEGVTGSGKTEVYLQVLAALLARGQQGLVLTPEIGLTPQLLARFSERLPGQLAVAHSGLSAQERLSAWLMASNGSAPLIVGTRSAVFMPLHAPGVIIIDEEHDPSFKQQDGFRYHARDLAIVRAQRLGIPIVLGSATPALESCYNAQRGRYQVLALPQRVGGARPPAIEVLDIRKQALREGLAPYLLAQIDQHLQRDEQVLLFLNRRGFAPVLLCHDCAWMSQCTHCDARMTVHLRRNRLICHHCGAQRPLDHTCPKCGSTELRGVGHGTERLEAALQQMFPEVALTRIDRDSTSQRGSLETLLADIQRGGRRLLVGTQMLAKGHHFPDVTLVGIIDADQGFYGVDFRASERLAQLILQVAGRAGRADKLGKVIIQTRHPQHPLLRILVSAGYPAFASAALAERQAAMLPPFAYQALLRAEAADASCATTFLKTACALAQPLAAAVEVLGPAPAPMERRAGRYRAHLLLQAAQRQDLHRFLDQWLPLLHAERPDRQLRWSLDVDAQELQ